MAVELVTGYAGKAHVSSSEDGARQAGTVGTGMYVLETVDEPLKATLENANTVTIGPGDVLINGRHVQLTGSTTFAVPVGTQGMQTSNLLVLRYELAEDETESVTAITLTGEPAASDPQDPELATGSVLDGDSPVDMALYRVVTTGIESAQPVRLFETVPPIAELTLGGLAGTLPVSKGGTGATSAAAARKSLGLGALATLASPLPVANGGTGQTSLQKARNAMGLGNTTGALPVANGGTGATTADAARSNLGLDGRMGYLKAGRGLVSDLSWNTLYNIAPGTHLVADNATNGPESGLYGNLLLSYSGGNRIVGLLAYDNGHVYTTYGYGAPAPGTFSWARIDNGAYGKLLWRGSWERGEVTIPGVNQYKILALAVSNFSTRMVGVNTGSGNISFFANDCWKDDSATDMAVSACRLTRSGSSETLKYDSGGRINLGNNYNYGYGVIAEVWGVA